MYHVSWVLVVLGGGAATLAMCVITTNCLGALPDSCATLGGERGLWQPLTPSLAPRPDLDEESGMGAAVAVPTAAVAPLPAPSLRASAPQNILATPASLFFTTAKGLPLPGPA